MSANNSNSSNSHPIKGRMIFGAFMVLVYVAVGVLCILDYFNFGNAGISIALGILLIIYGIWRGYRLTKGMP